MWFKRCPPPLEGQSGGNRAYISDASAEHVTSTLTLRNTSLAEAWTEDTWVYRGRIFAFHLDQPVDAENSPENPAFFTPNSYVPSVVGFRSYTLPEG